MRGKVQKFFTASTPCGITPAYAGKSNAVFISRSMGRDHPRLCGEKTPFSFKYFPSIGSPPPMRGKGFSEGVDFNSLRITPAYAGKSPFPL